MPYLAFKGEVAAPPHEVAARMAPHVGPHRWLPLGGSARDFTGTVSERGFRVMRAFRYKNSFNPWIVGAFRPTATGTEVAIWMTFHPAIWVFLCAWSLGFGSLLGRRDDGSFTASFHDLIAAGIVVFWVVAIVSFYVEAYRARRRLTELLRLQSASPGAGGVS